MSPTWHPNKIISPPRLKVVKQQRPAPDSRCFWCRNVLKDEGGGFYVNWMAQGDSGCPYSPLSCSPTDDWHYHGNDEGGTFPHSAREADDWGVEDFYDGACGLSDHETVGQVQNLLGGRFMAADSPYAVAEARDLYEEGAARLVVRRLHLLSEGLRERWRRHTPHCESGTCRHPDCHRCNPQWMCPEHASCINSLTCSSCDEPKGNVRFIGRDGMADTVHVPPDNPYAEHDALYGLQDNEINKYVNAYMENDDYYRDLDFEVLNEPVCINEKCQSFGL